jgi:hypothetical protein
MERTALVLSDLHYPHVDPKYISIATSLIKYLKPDYVIQCGDALDASTISSYTQNPKITNRLIDEIEAYRKQLDVWQKIMVPGSVFHQLEGNHSERLQRFVAKNCKEIHQLVNDIPTMLGFKERNKGGVKFVWHPLYKWDSCKIGDVVFHHGTYYDKNLAVTNLTRYPGVNFCQGHAHRYSHAAANGFWSVSLGHGSLAHKTAHIHAPNTTWQQAMGVVTFISGKGHFEPILVNNGKAVFRGKEFKA